MIPPGGQGQVTASIDSTRFKGPISKSVTLYTNDPANERSVLTLKAQILVPIDVRPRDRVVLRGKPAEMQPTVLHLVAAEGNPFDILEVSKQREDVQVAIKPAPELEPGADEKAKKGKKAKPRKDAVASGHSAYEMTITIAPDAQPGRVAERIRLTTTHPKMANIDISVSGKIDGNITVMPERLFFLSKNGASATHQELKISKRPEGGLEIKKITSTDATFEAKLVPISEGKEYKVEVNRTAEGVGSQATAQLIIETNDPLQPKIEVPLLAR